MKTKTCTRCKRNLPELFFAVVSSKSQKLRSQCRECVSEHNKHLACPSKVADRERRTRQVAMVYNSKFGSTE